MKVAFTPCPNDTALWDACIHGMVPSPMCIEPVLEDIETLNVAALHETYPLTKISAILYHEIREDYDIFPVGTAFARHTGPKIVAKTKDVDINNATVVTPGVHTSAHAALCHFYAPKKIITAPYNRILEQVESGTADAGVIIHETRFIFTELGFYELADLGALYQQQYKTPLPLGLYVIHRSVPAHTTEALIAMAKSSLQHFFSTKHLSPFILANAPESSEDSIRQHIEMFLHQI